MYIYNNIYYYIFYNIEYVVIYLVIYVHNYGFARWQRAFRVARYGFHGGSELVEDVHIYVDIYGLAHPSGARKNAVKQLAAADCERCPERAARRAAIPRGRSTQRAYVVIVRIHLIRAKVYLSHRVDIHGLVGNETVVSYGSLCQAPTHRKVKFLLLLCKNGRALCTSYGNSKFAFFSNIWYNIYRK